MDKRKSGVAVCVFVLVTIFILGTDAKKMSNKTTIGPCYKPCRVKSIPVCGSDGRNYTTGCHLSVARCKAKRNGQLLKMVNTGFCKNSKPVSLCHLNCTERRKPVCASDQKTYKNMCHYKRAKCKARRRKESPLTVVSRRGPCKKKSSSCRPYSSCPKVRRPVCGSDNRTYSHICFLKGKNCRIKRAARGKKYNKLTLKYCGACGRGKRCNSEWTQRCPEKKFCDQLLRAAVRYAESKKAAEVNSVQKNNKGNNQRVPRLQKKKNPVKKTKTRKTNPKKMKTKTMKNQKTSSKKSSLKKLHKIKQNSKPRNKPNAKKSKTDKTKPKKAKKSEKIIPKKMFEVCGSDGITYSSLCHLQVEQCNKINRCQRLQMKHKGACKKQSGRRT